VFAEPGPEGEAADTGAADSAAANSNGNDAEARGGSADADDNPAAE
jgi:hypothetical protein